LLKDFPKRILIIKALSTSFRPKEVEDEAVKDQIDPLEMKIKRFSDVGETPLHGTLESQGVIFSIENGFTQHDEWLGKSDVIGHSSFLPDIIKSLSNPFGKGTLEKTVLRGFEGLLHANLACEEDPHPQFVEDTQLGSSTLSAQCTTGIEN